MSVHTLFLAILEDFVGKRPVSRYLNTIPHRGLGALTYTGFPQFEWSLRTLVIDDPDGEALT
jgi:hypothetical protein